VPSRAAIMPHSSQPARKRRHPASPILSAIDIQRYSALLDRLYRGSSELFPFQSFLDELRVLLSLDFATLILRRPDADDAGMQFMSGLGQARVTDPSAINEYRLHNSLDPLRDLPLRTTITLDEIVPADKLAQSDYFQRYLAPHNLQHIAAIDLNDEADHRYALRLFRAASANNFDSAERALLELLAPHIARAIGNGVQRVQLDAERHFYAQAAFGRAVGSITLDEHGHIVQANSAAERFLAEKDGIARLHNQIHIKNTELNDSLRQQIQAALTIMRSNRNAEPTIQAMSIPRPSGKPDYELVLKLLPVDRYLTPSHSPHLLIFLSNPAEKVEISTRTLMTLYHLTQTEATLTIILAEGKTLDEVTQILGIARNTARAHLRAIFSKTGVTQQSMLVSLVLKSLASIAP
jgi:DNA-binding CsgD family transcriptional regulator/PAS domain-containing protein